MDKFGAVDWIVVFLVIIGGLNWGSVGLFNYDLVATIFGTMSSTARIIYSLIGLAAIYLAIISISKLTVDQK